MAMFRYSGLLLQHSSSSLLGSCTSPAVGVKNKLFDFIVFGFLWCGQRCVECFTELVELLDTDCRFHAVEIVTIVCSEYLLTQYFLFCLYSQGGVSRSSDGVKHGEQGPELGKLSTKVYTQFGAGGFSSLHRQNRQVLIRTKTSAGMWTNGETSLSCH